MADWLVEQGVTLAAMESTAAYWKPVFYCLEERMECWLLNAAQMKAVPGRKSDVKDAEWMAQLLKYSSTGWCDRRSCRHRRCAGCGT